MSWTECRSLVLAWQESLSFWTTVLVFCLLFGLFILCYALYEREFLSGCLQWSMHRKEHSGISKTGNRVEVMWDTVFSHHIAIWWEKTPPPANTNLRTRTRGQHRKEKYKEGGVWIVHNILWTPEFTQISHLFLSYERRCFYHRKANGHIISTREKLSNLKVPHFKSLWRKHFVWLITKLDGIM